jgi:hypothetical protein
MTDRRLIDVSAELRQLVKTLSRKWDAPGRLTSKRAEIQSLLDLYRDVLVIIERITSEGMPAIAFMDEYMKRPPQRSDASDVAAAQSFIARLAVDVKSLYHWTYAIEDFLAHSSVAARVDLSELNRISISGTSSWFITAVLRCGRAVRSLHRPKHGDPTPRTSDS